MSKGYLVFAVFYTSIAIDFFYSWLTGYPFRFAPANF